MTEIERTKTPSRGYNRSEDIGKRAAQIGFMRTFLGLFTEPWSKNSDKVFWNENFFDDKRYCLGYSGEVRSDGKIWRMKLETIDRDCYCQDKYKYLAYRSNDGSRLHGITREGIEYENRG